MSAVPQLNSSKLPMPCAWKRGCFIGSKQSWRIHGWRLLLVFAFALPGALQAQLVFVTNGGAINISGWTGTNTAVMIPASTNGMPVTRVLANAFQNLPTLLSVTVPASVTNYGFYSFSNCTNLLAVYFSGVAPVSFAPGAPPVFSAVPKATLYRLQGASGWGTTLDGLPVVLWDPQVLTQLIYTNDTKQVSVTGYTGPGGAVVIPATIEGKPVTTIASNSFFNLASLTDIIFPNTLTNVGSLAFANCTGLRNLTLPPGVIGSGVFSNCTALTNLVVPNNVTSLFHREFSGCTALTSLTLPGSISSLGAQAFQNCSNLNAIYFPSNAPTADPTAFDGANQVTNYYLPKTTGWGATLAGRPTVPILFTHTTNNGTITITRYIGIWGSVTIPPTINGRPVTTLGNGAFYQCSSLTNIDIGSGVTNIAGQAFVQCTNLLTITVSSLNPVYSSRDGVLLNKSQTTLLYYPGGRAGRYAIPNGVTTIPNYAFQVCPRLTSVTVPGSVTTISTLAFNEDPSLATIFFQGNAPNAAWSSFVIQSTTTGYYLPGTTGWGNYLDSLPMVLWNPLANMSDGSFGVLNHQFGFNITGTANIPLVVEATTNLAQPVWMPLQSVTLTNGLIYFSDAQWTNHPSRFYRIRSP